MVRTGTAALPGKKGKKKREPEWFSMAVTASAVRIGREGSGLDRHQPGGESDTTVYFEGMLDRPVLRMERACVPVFTNAEGSQPGSAIGGRGVWQVVVRLARPQFDDLVVLTAAERIAKVELLLQDLRVGKGVVRSVTFSTAPVPSEGEYE